MPSRPPVIRTTNPIENIELIPHAIFGRPISYFSLAPLDGHDDLDIFSYAAFALDNHCHFCLRYYRGHPKQTVTVYLESELEEPRQLALVIRSIVVGFKMPEFAVRWQRGDPVQFGSIRPLEGRLREPEARILALKIALTRPGGKATTEYIKDQVPNFVPLTDEDRLPSSSRKNEKKWQQVVGNVISHQEQRTSIFSQGFASRTDDGLCVTKRGREYLADMGFGPREVPDEQMKLKI